MMWNGDHRMADGKEPSGAQRMFGDFAPALVSFTDDVLFGQLWERTELPPRDRSLITVALRLPRTSSTQVTRACWYSWKMPPRRSRRRMSRWASCSGSAIGAGKGVLRAGVHDDARRKHAPVLPVFFSPFSVIPDRGHLRTRVRGGDGDDPWARLEGERLAQANGRAATDRHEPVDAVALSFAASGAYRCDWHVHLGPAVDAGVAVTEGLGHTPQSLGLAGGREQQDLPEAHTIDLLGQMPEGTGAADDPHRRRVVGEREGHRASSCLGWMTRSISARAKGIGRPYCAASSWSSQLTKRWMKLSDGEDRVTVDVGAVRDEDVGDELG
jgi:hypothetical protein